MWQTKNKTHFKKNNFQECLQNAKVRPFVGESVLVRGAVIVFGSPIKYDGKKLLVFADGLDGLPKVIGSMSNSCLSNWKKSLQNQIEIRNILNITQHLIKIEKKRQNIVYNDELP